MRIGGKSRYLLELIATLGIEAIEGLHLIPQYHRMINCSSERNFLRRTKALQDSGLIEFDKPRETGSWVARLTKSGKSIISGDIDPRTEWKAQWDGYWRLFAFDLPTNKSNERQSLRQWLKHNRLGKLQGSLWITPKNVDGNIDALKAGDADPSAIILFKGSFEGTHSNSDYVDTAWKFKSINERYARYINFLKRFRPESVTIEKLPEWFQKEVKVWREAFETDPFLPRELWSKEVQQNYLGPTALAAREDAYATWREKLAK